MADPTGEGFETVEDIFSIWNRDRGPQTGPEMVWSLVVSQPQGCFMLMLFQLVGDRQNWHRCACLRVSICTCS